MKTITTAIIKGGTGKTATAVAIAQAAILEGKRVLAVDIDPQANLTLNIGGDPNKAGAVELLNGSPASDVIQDTAQGIKLIAGHRDLSTQKTRPGSARRLYEALTPVANDFDLCIIDTAPALGELVYNALMAADGVIIPMETDTASLQGLYQIIDIVSHIQAVNKRLTIKGIILNRYDQRLNFTRYMTDVIQQEAEKLSLPVYTVRSSIAVREALAMSLNMFQYSPKSKAVEDFKRMYSGIIAGTI